MDRELPRDRLLDACGIAKTAGAKHDPREVRSILERAELSATRAQHAEEQTEQAYLRLKAFLREELPTHLVNVYEEVVREATAKSLLPLNQSVDNTASRIESCAEKLADFCWDWRLILLAVFLGSVTVLTGAAVLRFYVFTEQMKESQRYEVFGRRVEENIARYEKKDQERLYKYVGGRP